MCQSEIDAKYKKSAYPTLYDKSFVKKNIIKKK